MLDEFYEYIIREDIGDGDHSSLACIPADEEGKAELICKEDGILSGVAVALELFPKIAPNIQIDLRIKDGARIKKGDRAFFVTGPVRSILQAERLVLNLMQRMSGISTNTRRIVDSIAHTNCKVLDTRKTTPGLRWFEKEAVRIGGGTNHRFGLYDMIMLKDNHIDYAGGIEKAVERVKEYLKAEGRDLAIEVETRDLEEVKRVIACGGVDRIMFDNFSPDEIMEALKLIPQEMETEASGGINAETIVAYAETGVDFASMGALTHSVKSLDLSLKAIED